MVLQCKLIIRELLYFFHALLIIFLEINERLGLYMLHLGLAQKASVLTKMLIASRD